MGRYLYIEIIRIRAIEMRDAGLDEAVRAVGGVSELARQIGISQPSVSNWNRIPAERVLIVEAATGIDRKVLRPDLYGEPGQTQQAPDDVAAARDGVRVPQPAGLLRVAGAGRGRAPAGGAGARLRAGDGGAGAGGSRPAAGPHGRGGLDGAGPCPYSHLTLPTTLRV